MATIGRKIQADCRFALRALAEKETWISTAFGRRQAWFQNLVLNLQDNENPIVVLVGTSHHREVVILLMRKYAAEGA